LGRPAQNRSLKSVGETGSNTLKRNPKSYPVIAKIDTEMKPSLKRRKQQPRSKRSLGIKRNPKGGETNSSDHNNRRKERAKKKANAISELRPQSPKNPVYDVLKGRNVYLTTDNNGKQRFVPKESEATAKEKAKGLFIKDSTIIKKGKNALSKDAQPKLDSTGRNTYPVKGEDDTTQYLPKESDATQEEKNLGHYVEESSLNSSVKAKQASEGGLPIRDLGKGRKVYATRSEDGDQIFLPREQDATSYEKRKGFFVTNESAAMQTQGKQMAEGKPIRDVGKNRMAYPTASTDGEIVFYPRQSEATPNEIKRGQFVTDESVKDQTEKKTSQKEEAKYNKDKNRFEYPYEDQEGEITYLPKENEASEDEIAKGQFVNNKSAENPADQWTPIANGKPKYEADRYLYPVTDITGNLAYLPIATEAIARELENGLYLPFESIETSGRIIDRALREQQLHPIGPISASNATDQDRLLYAKTDPNDEVRYLPKASEATANEIANKQFIPDDETDPATARQDLGRKPFSEAIDGTALWDGKTLPAPTAQQQVVVLRSLKPNFDPEHGRMLYPVPKTDGTPQYLPLVEDATPEEIANGNYAQFTTEQPLTDVIQQHLGEQTHEVLNGVIKAIAIADVEKVFAEVLLKLASSKELKELLNNENALQQRWALLIIN